MEGHIKLCYKCTLFIKNPVPDKTAIINLTESNDTSDSQVSKTIFELYDSLSRVLDSKFLVAMYIVPSTIKGSVREK